jgi:hypothetical protein
MTHDLKLEGVEIPHSTACLPIIYRLHFTCYHFTSKNFWNIYLYSAQLYVIGSGNKNDKIVACIGSGISTLLFFQGLCETSNHSAWTSSTCKKKGAAFWVYCLSMLNGWKCCRYLGISNKVVKLFQFCLYKGQLAMAT